MNKCFFCSIEFSVKTKDINEVVLWCPFCGEEVLEPEERAIAEEYEHED